MVAAVITLPIASDSDRLRTLRAGRCRQADTILRALRAKAGQAVGIADTARRRTELRRIEHSLVTTVWPAHDADGRPTTYLSAAGELERAIDAVLRELPGATAALAAITR